MRILILGGTVFVGQAIAVEAVRRGHHVTTLSRGITGAPPRGVDAVKGDRSTSGGLSALAGRHFDAVVDTSRQAVSHVRRSAAMLAGRVERYSFISTVSVYADLSTPPITESAPVAAPLVTPTVDEEAEPSNYPGLNAACEHLVSDVYGDRALILRPCLIAGDRDPSDRFGYWPARVRRGGQILAPGDPAQPIQYIDVADLAAFQLDGLENALSGVYNVRGPQAHISMQDLLEACRGDVPTSFTWVSEEFLLAHDVAPYTEMPMWVPQTPDLAGFNQVSADRARRDGLTVRALSDTLHVALRWEEHLGLDRQRIAGLPASREAELLADWHRR